jgi:hypothetical protein
MVMIDASFPLWLHNLSIASIALGAVCAIAIALDEIRRPQKMWIMNLVWPLTALFGGVLWLAAYRAWGRDSAKGRECEAEQPFPAMVLKGTSHCGAGCTLGDIIAEWAAYFFPALAVVLGWHTAFAEKTFAVWIADFIVAFLLGVVFQYFTIKPMRDLSPWQGILAALKADVASITAWQVGMYGLMAVIQFLWFRPAYGNIAKVPSPEFWFAMQLAMLAGFVTSYPVNGWLIRSGVKEKM